MEEELKELKPCPFCGDEANMWCRGTRHGYMIIVKCDLCGAQTKAFWSDTDAADDDWNNQACKMAAKAWNRRA